MIVEGIFFALGVVVAVKARKVGLKFKSYRKRVERQVRDAEMDDQKKLRK